MLAIVRSLNRSTAARYRKIDNSRLSLKPESAGICNSRRIGNRSVVGYGLNGSYFYTDQTHCPFPAIRFRETTSDQFALKEKERGDWRRLSLEEKKTLYRASFCQTFAALEAPTGEWKSIIATTVLLISGSPWLWLFTHIFVHTKAPSSFSEESRAAQYWRQEAINNQPFTGNYKPKNADKYKPIPDSSADEDNRDKSPKNS